VSDMPSPEEMKKTRYEAARKALLERPMSLADFVPEEEPAGAFASGSPASPEGRKVYRAMEQGSLTPQGAPSATALMAQEALGGPVVQAAGKALKAAPLVGAAAEGFSSMAGRAKELVKGALKGKADEVVEGAATAGAKKADNTRAPGKVEQAAEAKDAEKGFRPSGMKNMSPDEFEETLRELPDARDVTRLIAQQAEDPVHRKIASRIVPFIENTSFRVVGKGDTAPRAIAYGSARGLHTYDVVRKGFNVVEAAPDTAILVRSRALGEASAGTNAETVLHEALHAATVRRLADSRLFKNEGTELAKARDELQGLFKKVAPDWKKAEFEGKPLYLNEDELVTYGLTNKNFQDFLKTVKIDGQSAWNKFVSLVAKLLNIPRDEQNALSELLRVTDRVLDAPLEELPLRIHTAGRKK